MARFLIKGMQVKKQDLTITVNHADLEQGMGGKATFDDLIKSGKEKFDGNRQPPRMTGLWLMSRVIQTEADARLWLDAHKKGPDNSGPFLWGWQSALSDQAGTQFACRQSPITSPPGCMSTTVPTRVA